MPVDPQFVGVLTLPGRTERAIAFAARTDVYFAYGRQTAWGALPSDAVDYPDGIDEANPPMPDPLATAIQEPYGYVQATLQLVVPDPEGSIDMDGVKYTPIDAAQARALMSPFVYVSAAIERGNMPTGKYRQLGLYSALVRDPADLLANPGRTELWVTPATPGEVHVAAPGILEYICNDLADDHRSNEIDEFEVVLTF